MDRAFGKFRKKRFFGFDGCERGLFFYLPVKECKLRLNNKRAAKSKFRGWLKMLQISFLQTAVNLILNG